MCQALEELMADELEAMRSEGEKNGRQDFAKLSRILLQQNRQKDLLRALEDEPYLEQLFQEHHI